MYNRVAGAYKPVDLTTLESDAYERVHLTHTPVVDTDQHTKFVIKHPHNSHMGTVAWLTRTFDVTVNYRHGHANEFSDHPVYINQPGFALQNAMRQLCTNFAGCTMRDNPSDWLPQYARLYRDDLAGAIRHSGRVFADTCRFDRIHSKHSNSVMRRISMEGKMRSAPQRYEIPGYEHDDGVTWESSSNARPNIDPDDFIDGLGRYDPAEDIEELDKLRTIDFYLLPDHKFTDLADATSNVNEYKAKKSAGTALTNFEKAILATYEPVLDDFDRVSTAIEDADAYKYPRTWLRLSEIIRVAGARNAGQHFNLPARDADEEWTRTGTISKVNMDFNDDIANWILDIENPSRADGSLPLKTAYFRTYMHNGSPICWAVLDDDYVQMVDQTIGNNAVVPDYDALWDAYEEKQRQKKTVLEAEEAAILDLQGQQSPDATDDQKAELAQKITKAEEEKKQAEERHTALVDKAFQDIVDYVDATSAVEALHDARLEIIEAEKEEKKAQEDLSTAQQNNHDIANDATKSPAEKEAANQALLDAQAAFQAAQNNTRQKIYEYDVIHAETITETNAQARIVELKKMFMEGARAGDRPMFFEQLAQICSDPDQSLQIFGHTGAADDPRPTLVDTILTRFTGFTDRMQLLKDKTHKFYNNRKGQYEISPFEMQYINTIDFESGRAFHNYVPFDDNFLRIEFTEPLVTGLHKPVEGAFIGCWANVGDCLPRVEGEVVYTMDWLPHTNLIYQGLDENYAGHFHYSVVSTRLDTVHYRGDFERLFGIPISVVPRHHMESWKLGDPVAFGSETYPDCQFESTRVHGDPLFIMLYSCFEEGPFEIRAQTLNCAPRILRLRLRLEAAPALELRNLEHITASRFRQYMPHFDGRGGLFVIPWSAIPIGSSSKFQSDTHGTIYIDRIQMDPCANHLADQRDSMPRYYLRATAIYKDSFLTLENNVQRLGWDM